MHQAAPIQIILQQKKSEDFRILPSLCGFAGWKFLHRNNRVQDENYEENYQLSHCKHGHVRSSVSNFRIPVHFNRDAGYLMA